MSLGGLRSERGFTLIEALVAMVSGLIVVSAAFTILEVSLRQSTRIADKVSADQRGRVALEKIMLELHSTCVSNGANPIRPESTATKLIFFSQSGTSEPVFTSGVKHEILFTGSTLYDNTYLSNGGSGEGHWLYPGAPTKSVILLANVYAPTTGSMFEYFRYPKTGTQLPSQAQTVPLSVEEAKATAKVNVNFTAAPDTNNTATGRPVAFSDTAILRLTPATEVGSNEPCE